MFGTSSLAQAMEPAEAQPGATAPSNDRGASPSPDDDGTAAEPAPTPDESSPSPDRTPDESSAPTEEPAEDIAEPPAPRVYDYDSPDLERRGRSSAAPTATDAQDPLQLRRARLGGILVGVGLTAAVVAPVVVVRPRPAIAVDTGDGTSLALSADGGPLIAGGVVSVVGGVTTIVGGRMLSDLGGDPRHAPRRQRALGIASGVSFGVASGLFVAGVVDMARGGVLWNNVLEREFSPENVVDGEEAGRRITRGIAMLSAALPMAGLGLGLSLGDDARARVVPSGAGVAVVGQF
ncbi:MAG: hypothetical protein AAF799_02950 [Myxococcota bacterium]